MRSLLTEVERIKQMIGLPVNEMAKPSEQHIKSIQTILSANNLLKKEAESLLNQIIELADDQIINFGDILPQHWTMKDIDDFSNAKKIVVILNNKII